MIEIDIISGFLGAGKTTFANILLRHYLDAGLRPVYIVNEIGQSGVDAEVLREDGFDAVEVEGGCICCTLKDDIASAMIEVINTFSPTNIVFEPSGIFIFDNFFDILKQPAINERCELKNIFTIVDSVSFSFAKAAYGSFIYNQIKNAAIIVISKLERKSSNKDELLCDIKNINADAFIMSKIWTDWDKADLEMLLAQSKRRPLGSHGHHHSDFSVFTLKPEKPFSRQKAERFIHHCKSGDFGNLCRVKGIVKIEGQAMLINIAMQDAVLKRFGGIAKPTLTFIGQAINEQKIEAFLKQELC